MNPAMNLEIWRRRSGSMRESVRGHSGASAGHVSTEEVLRPRVTMRPKGKFGHFPFETGFTVREGF